MNQVIVELPSLRPANNELKRLALSQLDCILFNEPIVTNKPEIRSNAFRGYKRIKLQGTFSIKSGENLLAQKIE